jgi:hypothetical protein
VWAKRERRVVDGHEPLEEVISPQQTAEDGHMVCHTYEKGLTMAAEIGEAAPDFTLPSANNETISLSQFRGQKHVILSFHVFNFTSG